MISLAAILLLILTLYVIFLIRRRRQMPTDKEVLAQMDKMNTRAADEPLHMNHLRRNNKNDR